MRKILNAISDAVAVFTITVCWSVELMGMAVFAQGLSAKQCVVAIIVSGIALLYIEVVGVVMHGIEEPKFTVKWAASLALIVAALSVMYWTPYSDRKAFVFAYQRLKVGASVGEVNRMMKRYDKWVDTPGDEYSKSFPVDETSKWVTSAQARYKIERSGALWIDMMSFHYSPGQGSDNDSVAVYFANGHVVDAVFFAN